MSSKLLLIRHAKSSWQIDVTDQLRPLNSRGYAACQIMAQRPILMGNRPDIILCSTAIRAYSTAVCLMDELQLDSNLLRLCSQLYLGSLQEILNEVDKVILGCDPNIEPDQTIWVVGHNPAMQDAVEALCDNYIDEFPTLAAAEFVKTKGRWQLQCFDAPKFPNPKYF